MPPRCKKASFANYGFIPFASETAWKGPPCPRPGLGEAERACTGHCVIPTAIDTGCLGGHCWLHCCVPMTRGQDLSWVQSGEGRGQRGEQKAAFWPPSTCFQHLRTALRLCSSRVFLQGLWTTQSFTEASITRLADLLGKVTLASLLRNSLVPHSSYEHPTNP